MNKELNFVGNLIKEYQKINNLDSYEEQYAKYILLKEKTKNFIKIVLLDNSRLKEIEELNEIKARIKSNLSPVEISKRKKSALNKKMGNLLRILFSIKNELGIKEEFNPTSELNKEKNSSSVPYIEEINNAIKEGDLNIIDKELLRSCKTSFDAKEYWDSCSHAFRHLETRIRKKGELPQNLSGVELINSAFDQTGKLTLPFCGTKEEEKGFHLLNLGIVKFHRNAKLHREGQIDKEAAIKIIGYIDYLLSLIETCEIKG